MTHKAYNIIKKISLTAAILFCSISLFASLPGPLTFMLTIKSGNISDSTAILLPWNIVSKQYTDIEPISFSIKNLNNDKLIEPFLYDSDADGKPNFLVFYTKLEKTEPILPFQLTYLDGQKNKLQNTVINNNSESYTITYLQQANQYISNVNLDGKWANKIARSIIETYPDPKNLEIFRSFDWNYTNGFFINSLCELYSKTNDSLYLNYAIKWINLFILPNGSLDKSHIEKEKYELDEILPGRSLLYLNKYTGNERYKIAAIQLLEQLKTQPRTSDGGFWHKKVYTNQMWLDGIYMADVYMLQFASQYNQPQWADDAMHQFLAIYNHTLDSKTGLLYHGWDESKNKIWANQITGTSPEFWGRGIGWYVMALADALDYIPVNHPNRDSLVNIFKKLTASLANFQDEKTGLWFQVVNKGNESGNWIETSASAMFAYAFAKGYKKGILNKSYYTKALKAFNGLKNDYLYFDDAGKIYFTGTVKVGTLSFKNSDGSYKYYIGVDRRINDFKGLSALLYLCEQLEY